MKRILYFIVVAIVVSGCTTTKYIPQIVERVKTDTLYQTKTMHDSIYVHDSTIVRMAGDTVYMERWHTAWRERLLTDTVYQSRTDSIPVPVEVPVEVPAELSFWQKLQIYLSMIFAAIFLALYLWERKK